MVEPKKKKKKIKVKVGKRTKARLEKEKHDAVLTKYIELKGNVATKDLAKEFKVKVSQVEQWMKDEEWIDKYYDTIHLSPDTIELMNSAGEDYGLTEQEEMFAYHYLRTANAHTSALHAGYAPQDASRLGSNLLKADHIRKFIQALKTQTKTESFVQASDIINMYERIAMADITDFIEVSKNGVPRLKPHFDGQLVKTIKKGKDGITFELYDKKWAIEKMDEYTQAVPNRGLEKSLELQETRVNIEKAKLGDDGTGDKLVDGFEDAFESTVAKLWGTSPNNEEEDEDAEQDES